MKFEIENHVLTRCIAEFGDIIAIVPDGVTRIKFRAFGDCKYLKKIHLPDSITSIGAWAFGDCESLKEIRL
ncbi:MAG: leucine-rich repeat protein, partial [Ruminococcus sp.]|nr:leucine-rich repeat protein [Ruminococcus sp.]